jgi:hypothetical protein
MSLLKKLFGGKADSTKKGASPARLAHLVPPGPGRPTYVDQVAEGVAVDFYAHDNVEGVTGNFLTAVTEGLGKLRQQELVLSLRLEADEDPVPKMQDIVRFVATVHAWAIEGNIVHEGGLTQFGERGLFGRAHSGLLYADARPMPGVKLPERALSAIFVSEPEIRGARELGTYRVLTRMGLQARVFPSPSWGELERPSVMTARESESELANVPRLRAQGVSFVFDANRLVVSIPSDAVTLLSGLRTIPEGVPFALLVRPAPLADAILVWSPGQEEMSGISKEGASGSRLSGSCLLVTPGAQRNELRQCEDGYAVAFRNEAWAELSAALVTQQPFALAMAEGLRFEIVWYRREE